MSTKLTIDQFGHVSNSMIERFRQFLFPKNNRKIHVILFALKR